MCINPADIAQRRQSGISLVEVIIFIVVVSVGVAGLMSVMSSVLKYSADPMIRKQAIAVAESLLEEIMLQPFTVCDPDFYDAATGTCTQTEAMGPEPGEDRYSTTTPFDNVNDYHGFQMHDGIRSITDAGTKIAGLEKYQADVAVTQAGTTFGLAAAEALKISVTVTDPNSQTITLTGYRLRYAPTP